MEHILKKFLNGTLINEYLKKVEGGRACCWKAESRENKSNGAYFQKIPQWYAN